MKDCKTVSRKRRSVWLASMCLTAAMLGCSLAGTIVTVGAEDLSVLIENGAESVLETTYTKGETYTLPTDVKITYGGKNYDASVILRDPDGNGYSAETVSLSVAGRYTLEYRATSDDGKLLIAKEYFSCLESLFSVNSTRSSASYVESVELQSGITGEAGIALSVAKGDTFTYNQIIDVSEATKNEKLISFYVTPTTLYNYDAGAINFVLTDAFDESNSVTITVKRTLLVSTADMMHYSYVTANASDQPPTAINQPVQSQYPSVTVDGDTYSLHVSNAYGRAVRHSMYGGYDGAADEASYLGKTMSLSFDAESKRVYAWAINGTEPVLVADLDDFAQFDEAWTGFTSGKVLLSVNMSSYRALTSNLVITKIGEDDLTADYARDASAPVISVDLQDYDEDALPEARMGTQYPIFGASALDETDGALDYDVSVWYNYASEETRIRVSTDGGSFTPTMAGTYTIVYSAQDRSGNVANVAYNVEASALGALTLTYSADTTEIPAGQKLTVSDVSLSGGSGNKTLRAVAVLDSDPSVSYELQNSGSGYSFVPLYSGNYTITFTYSDYLEEKTETVAVKVTAAEGAYIEEEAAVPRYVLSGATYEIPALSGYVFGNGPSVASCTVSVEGGTVSDDTFFVTAESGYVTLTYTLAMEGGSSAVKTYSIPVVAGTGVDSDSLDMRKLFVQNTEELSANERADVAISLTSEDYNGRLVATVTNTSGDAMAYGAFDFVNKVLASSLSTQFAIDSNAFLYFTIYVTDSVDPSQQVKITYSNAGSWKVNFSVNDGYTYSTSYTGSSTIDLAYNADAYTFTTNTNISASVATYLNGTPFQGFTSGYVYLTFCIDGVYKATDSGSVGGVRINSINNQTISGVKTDNIAPQVTAYASKGDLSVGTVTEIPAFLVCDVINPYAKIGVKVTSPSGQTVVSTDGVALDGTQDISRSYEILLSEYGSYTISVSGVVGTDKSSFGVNYGISVLDMSAPEVVFIDPVTEAKVGDTVKFAAIHVSDDQTAAEDIIVTAYLMAPDGRMTKVDLSVYGSFTASTAGEYRLIIYACDEGNLYGSTTVRNTAIVWYTITVTE